MHLLLSLHLTQSVNTHAYFPNYLFVHICDCRWEIKVQPKAKAVPSGTPLTEHDLN
jgi:hypothetical protein